MASTQQAMLLPSNVPFINNTAGIGERVFVTENAIKKELYHQTMSRIS